MAGQSITPNSDKKKRGRPERMMKFEGTPEELAKALFARARPADPSKQKPEKQPPR